MALQFIASWVLWKNIRFVAWRLIALLKNLIGPIELLQANRLLERFLSVELGDSSTCPDLLQAGEALSDLLSIVSQKTSLLILVVSILNIDTTQVTIGFLIEWILFQWRLLIPLQSSHRIINRIVPLSTDVSSDRLLRVKKRKLTSIGHLLRPSTRAILEHLRWQFNHFRIAKHLYPYGVTFKFIAQLHRLQQITDLYLSRVLRLYVWQVPPIFNLGIQCDPWHVLGIFVWLFLMVVAIVQALRFRFAVSIQSAVVLIKDNSVEVLNIDLEISLKLLPFWWWSLFALYPDLLHFAVLLGSRILIILIELE